MFWSHSGVKSVGASFGSYIEASWTRAGSRPGSRATFVSAKVAKTMLAVAWPFGSPARFADFGGAQTRCAQTMPAFFRSRLHGSASPQGQGIPIMFCFSWTNSGPSHWLSIPVTGNVFNLFPLLLYPTPADRIPGRTL